MPNPITGTMGWIAKRRATRQRGDGAQSYHRLQHLPAGLPQGIAIRQEAGG
jgi:hypothetical protein